MVSLREKAVDIHVSFFKGPTYRAIRGIKERKWMQWNLNLETQTQDLFFSFQFDTFLAFCFGVENTEKWNEMERGKIEKDQDQKICDQFTNSKSLVLKRTVGIPCWVYFCKERLVSWKG